MLDSNIVQAVNAMTNEADDAVLMLVVLMTVGQRWVYFIILLSFGQGKSVSLDDLHLFMFCGYSKSSLLVHDEKRGGI